MKVNYIGLLELKKCKDFPSSVQFKLVAFFQKEAVF